MSLKVSFIFVEKNFSCKWLKHIDIELVVTDRQIIGLVVTDRQINTPMDQLLPSQDKIS